jgi:manganese efflux pump family protein
MTTVTLALAPVASVTLPPPSGSSGGPFGIAALISWLLTAGIGGYMLRTWVARGGLARQRATGVGVPPQVVFGHASAALTGLAVWVIYLSSGWHPLAWIGVVLVGTAITLGICTVTLWTPYPIRAEPAGGGDAQFAAVSQVKTPARPDVTVGTAAAAAEAEQPDPFTVTDEMIARLLAEPHGVSRRRRLHLLPLIPAIHGFAAMATFLLATTTAIGVR